MFELDYWSTSMIYSLFFYEWRFLVQYKGNHLKTFWTPFCNTIFIWFRWFNYDKASCKILICDLPFQTLSTKRFVWIYCRHLYPGSVQRNSSENILNVLLECSEKTYIQIYLGGSRTLGLPVKTVFGGLCICGNLIRVYIKYPHITGDSFENEGCIWNVIKNLELFENIFKY